MAYGRGLKTLSCTAEDPLEVMGINTPGELARAERRMAELSRAGVDAGVAS
jgi:hypothetical protein